MRREVINVTIWIRSKKLREHHYKGQTRCFENKREEWDVESNVEHIQE